MLLMWWWLSWLWSWWSLVLITSFGKQFKHPVSEERDRVGVKVEVRSRVRFTVRVMFRSGWYTIWSELGLG